MRIRFCSALAAQKLQQFLGLGCGEQLFGRLRVREDLLQGGGLLAARAPHQLGEVSPLGGFF